MDISAKCADAPDCNHGFAECFRLCLSRPSRTPSSNRNFNAPRLKFAIWLLNRLVRNLKRHDAPTSNQPLVTSDTLDILDRYTISQ